MNLKAQEMILHLIQSCSHSEICLSMFCEEFIFYYLHLEEGTFKHMCKTLFHQASDFMMREPHQVITPDEIQTASDLLNILDETYKQLSLHHLRS